MEKLISAAVLLGPVGNLTASACECRNPTWENKKYEASTYECGNLAWKNEKQETSMGARDKQNLMKFPDNNFASLMLQTLVVLSISVLVKWYLKVRNFNLSLKILINRLERYSDALNRLYPDDYKCEKCLEIFLANSAFRRIFRLI